MQQQLDGRAEPLVTACRSIRCPCTSFRTCHCFGKVPLQAVKKFYAILYFGFNLTLVLDAEARLVKRAVLREAVFDTFVRHPSYWLEPHPSPAVKNGSLLRILGMNATTLCGPGGPSACPLAHSLQHWFYRQEWMAALSAQVRATHGSLVNGLCGAGARVNHTSSFGSWLGDEPVAVYEPDLAFNFIRYWSRLHGKQAEYPFFQSPRGLLGPRGMLALFDNFRPSSEADPQWAAHHRLVANKQRPILVFTPHGPRPKDLVRANYSMLRRFVCSHDGVLFFQVTFGEDRWDCENHSVPEFREEDPASRERVRELCPSRLSCDG